MGCACIRSNKIIISPYCPNEKTIESCLNEDDQEYQKLQKDLEENVLFIISSSQSIDSIKDTSNGDFLGYNSFISDLEN